MQHSLFSTLTCLKRLVGLDCSTGDARAVLIETIDPNVKDMWGFAPAHDR
jgi:hypothetical protein